MSRRIVIEMQGVDKRRLAEVWARMRQGEKLVGDDTYLGRSMADHPEWFPIFETMDVLAGDDRQPSGEDPFEHLTFHLIVGSQIFHRSPDEAETFYRLRLRAGDDPHEIVHMMIAVFQRHLAWAAEHPTADGRPHIDLKAYGQTLKVLWALKHKKLWERLGFDEAPAVHGKTIRRRSK
ncbi:MAG: DUF1841 family protein [Myxococcales bacterium]|nr:DUF1841 family protein [Myxococcales bacterium]